MNVNDIIKYPILTEKTYLQMQENVYTFAVDRKATKIEIKKAVEFIFQVKVESVNTFNVPKKEKRIGRYTGYTNSYKRAIIKLAEGSITIFPEEGIKKEDVNKEQEAKVEKLKEVSDAEKKAAEKIKKAQKSEAKETKEKESK